MVQDSGVRGVAWATFIAQGVACVLTLIFVFLRASKFKSDESKKVYSFGLLKLLLLLSLPIVLQNSFVSVGNLILQVRINELAQVQGIGITSGFTAGSKLVVFCTTCICTWRKRSYEFRVAELRRAQVQTDKAGLRLVACHFFRYCFAVCRGVSYFYRAAYKFVYGTGRGR